MSADDSDAASVSSGTSPNGPISDEVEENAIGDAANPVVEPTSAAPSSTAVPLPSPEPSASPAPTAAPTPVPTPIEPDKLRVRSLEILSDRSPINSIVHSLDPHLNLIGRALSLQIPPAPVVQKNGGGEAGQKAIDWSSERNLRRSIGEEISAYNAAQPGLRESSSEAEDATGQDTEITLEKITLRDELAMNDLKIASLALGSQDEIKQVQEEFYKQISEVDAVLRTVKQGLDQLGSDLTLVRSLKSVGAADLDQDFFSDLAVRNKAFGQDLLAVRKLDKQYFQLAAEVKKHPKNDQLASKAGAAGRKRKAAKSTLERSYLRLIEKTERAILAQMVDFTEYQEYLGRMKDRYNRDVGFLIVYEPVAETRVDPARKQLLENRAKLVSKLDDSRAELSDDDEVLFFRRQILGRLLGQAPAPTTPESANGSGSDLKAAPQPKEKSEVGTMEKGKGGFVIH